MDNCTHPEPDQRVVSDVVIYIGIRNDSDGAHEYETARQIIACQRCGRVVDVIEVDRPRS
jgi:hypothetical protein